MHCVFRLRFYLSIFEPAPITRRIQISTELLCILLGLSSTGRTGGADSRLAGVRAF